MINQNWKKLIKPNRLNVKNNEDKSISTVTAEPLEKGYALTVGNSLRRILLSSIQGSAITAVQFKFDQGTVGAGTFKLYGIK